MAANGAQRAPDRWCLIPTESVLGWVSLGAKGPWTTFGLLAQDFNSGLGGTQAWTPKSACNIITIHKNSLLKITFFLKKSFEDVMPPQKIH